MIYIVKILSINRNIEDILTIKLGNQILEVFSFDMPHEICVNKSYSANITFNIFADYQINLSDQKLGCYQIGSSLAYKIVGKLNNGNIEINNLSFFDEILQSEYAYLDNKIISWVVDRIDLNFLL